MGNLLINRLLPFVLLAVTTSAAVSQVAFAQGNKQKLENELEKEAEESFKRRDRDKTGYITKDKATGALRDVWDTYDKNKDGKIDLAEYMEYYKNRMATLRGGDNPSTETPKKSKLEEMLETALKNNPDIRVADAKVREADAIANRTRLDVTQKVVQLYHSIEAARANVQVAEKELERMRLLEKQRTVSQGEVAASKAKLVQAKTELSKLEAEVPYVLGQQNLQFSGEIRLEASGPARVTLSDGTSLSISSVRLGPMDDKLRAALDKPITIEMKAPKLDEFLQTLRKVSPEILIHHVKVTLGDDQLSDVEFRQVPLGAVLQWLQDEMVQSRIVVRNYGVLLTHEANLPPGAVLLDEFWKSKPKQTTKPKEEKK